MGNCQCWQAKLNETTLRSKVALPDELNISAMPPRLAKLAEKAISSQSEEITQIDLSNRELGDEGGIYLQSILQYYTHITSLLLASTRLGPETWPGLMETLLEFTKLLELDLSHNFLGHKGAERLSSALPRMMKLENLLLEDVQLGQTGWH